MKDETSEVEAATERLRQTIREANGVRKDLMRMLKEIQETLTSAEDVVSERLQVHVKHHTDELAALFAKVGAEMSQRLFRRFEEIANILLGKSEGLDGEDLKAAALRVRAAMHNYRNNTEIPEAYRRLKK